MLHNQLKTFNCKKVLATSVVYISLFSWKMDRLLILILHIMSLIIITIIKVSAYHICIFWMISVHVALQQGESREGPSAVAGDVGGGLEPTHPGRGAGESRAKERGRQGAVFVKRADNT